MKWPRLVAVCLILSASLGFTITPVNATAGVAPTIVSPTSGSTVGGIVPVAVTTNAPYVATRWAGTEIVAGAPAAGGVANAQLPSYGLAGSATIEVAECLNAVPSDPAALQGFLDSCLTDAGVDESTSVPVVVSNTPPTFVPDNASRFWDPHEELTVAATATGGALLFSGFPGADPALDATPPYSSTFPPKPAMPEGTSFAITVTLCSAPWAPGSYVCDATATATLTVTAKMLAPKINGAVPNPFSPNGDGYKDSLTVTYTLDETQEVSYKIVRKDGSAVTAEESLGTSPAGTYSFTWSPPASLGLRSGNYAVELHTSAVFDGITFSGAAKRPFAIDVTKPTFTSVKASPGKIYPVSDGYRDSAVLSSTVSEHLSSVKVTISNSSGRKVRTLRVTGRGPGKISVTWNGRLPSGALAPEGRYSFRFVGRDDQRIQGVSPAGSITVSHKRLVTRTATVTRYGDQRTSVWHTGPSSCVGFSESASNFSRGLWIANVCKIEYGYTDIEARYSFSVPNALVYKSITLQTYGAATPLPPIFLGGGMYSKRSGWAYADAFKIGNKTAAWRNLAYVGPSLAGDFVKNGVVKGAVYLPGVYGADAYDIGMMRVIVKYAVLQ